MNKKALKTEILKCGTSPIYFINKYVKIEHPVKGLIPFKLYDYQEQLIRDFRENRFNVVNKARQMGISEINAAYSLWLMLFRRNKNIVTMATKKSVAAKIVRKVRLGYQHLPKWLKISEILVDNVNSLEFRNNSRITALSTTEDSGRSEAGSLMLIDEAAHIADLERIWTGIKPVISTGGSVSMFSTPLGVGNTFHTIYTQSVRGENNFKASKLMWWENPDHVHNFRDDPSKPGGKTSDWFEFETAGFSYRQIAQEYCCFDGNTRVATRYGFRKLKDICVGDEVLTHRGRYKKVLFTNNRIAQDIFKFKSYNNRLNTFVSSEHPFLSFYEEWLEAGDVEEKDIICSFPKNVRNNKEKFTFDLLDITPEFFKILEDKNDSTKCFLNDRKHKTVHNRFVDIDYDFGYVLGLYLAEGDSSKYCKNINLYFNYEEELNTWVKTVISFIENKIGISCKINKRGNNCGVLSINSSIFKSFMELFYIGDRAWNKKLSKFSYEIGNEDFFKGIVDGVFDGDGCIKERYTKKLRSTSLNLIYDIKYLCSVLGLNTSLLKNTFYEHQTIEGRLCKQKQSYSLAILGSGGVKIDKITDLLDNKQDIRECYKSRYNKNDNFLVASVIEKKKNKPIRVYNIEVEDDNSYVTEHFVVHNCEFLASGDTFIPTEQIEYIEQHTVMKPVKQDSVNRDVYIWNEPNPMSRYLVTADVARGDGEDYSAATVYDINQMMQVAEYKGKATPDDFAQILCRLGTQYNKAILVVEQNSVGFSCLEHIKLIGYENLYYSAKGDLVGGETFDTSLPLPSMNKFVPGITTSPKNRPLILSKFEEYIRTRRIIIRSERLLEELRRFIWKNNKAEAAKGYNDDLIMSAAIACWIKDTYLDGNILSEELSKDLLSSISKQEINNVAVPGATTNPDFVRENERKWRNSQENPYKMKDSRGNTLDVGWLIDFG